MAVPCLTVQQTYTGLRVLELGAVIAGPFTAMILADLGADVVKVENPDGGDDSRRMPPQFGDQSALYQAMNRNKRSLVLDLKSEAGRDAVLRLVNRADVVIESFRPGVSDRLGIGYEALRRRNPALIYCAISAFGESPSGRGLPGYDPLIQAFSGLMSMTGDPEAPPARVAASVIDLTTGMWAAMGVMSALARRAQDGQGRYVESTLIDSGYMLLCHQISSMLATGEVPTRIGSASPIAAPYEAFRTADGWLMIAAGNDASFGRLCRALDVAQLLDRQELLSNAGRVAHRHELNAVLQKRLAQKDSATWTALLEKAGVPAGPVQDLDEAVRHPIMAERAMLAVPEGGASKQASVLRVPFDDARPPRMRAAPTLGQHSAEILREIGFDAAQIETMLQKPPAG
jgi:CoA:oxalate CoA-transferase